MSHNAIYYMDGNERRGPLALSQIEALNLPPQTPVWYAELADWTPICQAPLTAHLYSTATPPRSDGSPYVAPGSPTGGYVPDKPSTYLVWAILTTLFCCLPFGIVSIVYAARVDSLYYAGRYSEAQDASRKARLWAIWSAVTSVIISVLYFFSILFLGLAPLALVNL